MVLNLRGHHLICLHFFGGEGYDAAFIKNLRDILQRTEYEDIIVTEGADDVCRMCPYLINNQCQYQKGADLQIKEMDQKALGLLGVSVGDKVKWHEIKERVSDIFPDWFSGYCHDCDWLSVCEKDVFYKSLRQGQRRY